MKIVFTFSLDVSAEHFAEYEDYVKAVKKYDHNPGIEIDWKFGEVPRRKDYIDNSFFGDPAELADFSLRVNWIHWHIDHVMINLKIVS